MSRQGTQAPVFRGSLARAAGVLLLAWVPALVAEDPAAVPVPTVRWRISAECKMVVLPQKLALPIMAQFGEPAAASAAWAEVERLVGNGEAELAAELVIEGAASKRLVTETMQETLYPSEFECPFPPDRLPRKNALEALEAWPDLCATPNWFEQRPAGAQLELETAVGGDGRWIDVSLVATHTRFLGYRLFDYAAKLDGKKLALPQPLFSTLKNTSSFRVRNGERILIGAHKVPETEKKVEFFILEVRAKDGGGAIIK